MKQQDLKALAGMAVDHAVAARRTASVELTEEQIAGVSGGGAAGLSYIKDPTWYGIWEILKTVKAAQVDVAVVAQPIAVDANPRLDAAARIGF